MDENQLDYEDQGLMCTAMHDEQEVRQRNPKMYGQYPSCFMMKIPPAGKQTFKSEGVYNILSTF